MKMIVYRYKVYDHQHDDLAHIPPHYATRDYIEQLEGTTIIEYDHLEVDESDLDALGRTASKYCGLSPSIVRMSPLK
jgi:hypothetical protein